MSPPPEFVTGDEVEVCPEEDGFRGGRFAARVVRSTPKLRRFNVEYETLIDDSNPPKKLRETVDSSILRPRPPTPPVSTCPFMVGEQVDAFHNDGWWDGVVSKVLEGGKRYGIRFPESNVELEFPPEELRVHMAWIDGKWFTPPKSTRQHIGTFSSKFWMAQKSLLKNEFSIGSVVEVSIDEDGFRGAWYTATVMGSSEEKFLVEYQSLKTDDETALLKEEVDYLHVRPTPPDTPVVGEFKLLQEVDVFYNDGWWVGVISKVLDHSRYMVYFRSSVEEMEFGHTDLRLHFEWIGGRWVQLSEVLEL